MKKRAFALVLLSSSMQPHRAFALSFTSNNLSGNWGDYIDR